MKKFVVREKVENGALISLSTLMEKLLCLEAPIWVFRDIDLHYGMPFGLYAPEFERLTRTIPGGFRVTAAEFQAFLKTDFQIMNGFIEGVCQTDTDDWLFQIECFDSSEWDILVKSPQLAAVLESVLRGNSAKRNNNE